MTEKKTSVAGLENTVFKLPGFSIGGSSNRVGMVLVGWVRDLTRRIPEHAQASLFVTLINSCQELFDSLSNSDDTSECYGQSLRDGLNLIRQGLNNFLSSTQEGRETSKASKSALLGQLSLWDNLCQPDSGGSCPISCRKSDHKVQYCSIFEDEVIEVEIDDEIYGYYGSSITLLLRELEELISFLSPDLNKQVSVQLGLTLQNDFRDDFVLDGKSKLAFSGYDGKIVNNSGVITVNFSLPKFVFGNAAMAQKWESLQALVYVFAHEIAVHCLQDILCDRDVDATETAFVEGFVDRTVEAFLNSRWSDYGAQGAALKKGAKLVQKTREQKPGPIGRAIRDGRELFFRMSDIVDFWLNADTNFDGSGGREVTDYVIRLAFLMHMCDFKDAEEGGLSQFHHCIMDAFDILACAINDHQKELSREPLHLSFPGLLSMPLDRRARVMLSGLYALLELIRDATYEQIPVIELFEGAFIKGSPTELEVSVKKIISTLYNAP